MEGHDLVGSSMLRKLAEHFHNMTKLGFYTGFHNFTFYKVLSKYQCQGSMSPHRC